MKEETKVSGVSTTGAVGIAVAVMLSYTKWHSITWAIVHGFCGWFYIIYFCIRYK